MKSHPMVLNMACQSVVLQCAVLDAVGAEIPYAVVPADASRWGPIVRWVTLRPCVSRQRES